MVELSVVLVTVAREFDFRDCYAEWDALNSGKKGRMTDRGERAYLVEEGAAQPADG